MNRQSALLPVVCAACSQAPSPSPVVTEAVWHLEVAMAPVDGEVGPAAVSYLGDADLGLSDEEDLVVRSVSTGTDTLRHVRLQETHRGVPVLGSEIAVHADDTTFLGYGGTVTRNLEGVPVEPSIDGEQALAIARDHLSAAAGSEIRPARETTLLALRPRPGAVDLVWRVEVLGEGQAGVAPGRWFYLVEAETGEVLDRHDGLTTAEQASGPGGNPNRSAAGPRRWTWSRSAASSRWRPDGWSPST